jgi:acyl carrier protein
MTSTPAPAVVQSPAAQAAGQSTEQRVVEMISQLAAVRPSEIKLQDRLREDLGLDSVCSMELLSMLAEQLDLDVQIEEAMRVTTVGAAVEMVEAHLQRKLAGA